MKSLRYLWLLLLALAAMPAAGQRPGFRASDLASLKPAETGGGGGAFTPYTAGFDGANDVMVMNGTPTGFADAKTVTISVWLDFTGGDGTRQFVFWHTGDRLNLEKTASNTIRIVGAGAGSYLDVTSSVTKTASDGWFHLLITVDLNGGNSANCHFYFDGVEDNSKTVTTYVDGTLDLDVGGTPARRVGAQNSSLNKLNASICELWIANRVVNDVSKFRDSGTSKPISLGSDGSTPDGSKPGFYFSRNGSGDSWIVDSANGNTFTLTGALGSPAAP